MPARKITRFTTQSIASEENMHARQDIPDTNKIPSSLASIAQSNEGLQGIQELFDTLNTAFENKNLPLQDPTLHMDQRNNLDENKVAQNRASLQYSFQETMEHLDIGIMMVDQNERVQLCNRSAIRMLDLPADFIAAKPQYCDLVALQSAQGEFDTLDDELKKAILERTINCAPGIYRRKRSNGATIDIKTIKLALGGFIRTYTDVTESVARENALVVAKAEFEGLFENSITGIYRSSPDGKQLRANPALVRLNGYDSEAEMLKGVGDIATEWYVNPDRRDDFKRQMAQNGRVTDFVSQIYRHRTREPIWISETAWETLGIDGRIYYEGTITETTERKEAEDRITYLALHDQLTGLSNRASFLQHLHNVVAKRSDARVTIFSIDLDGFKAINDGFGHAAGDKLLVKAALAIRQCADREDIIARLGGDEFAILRVSKNCTMAELGVTAAGLVQQLSQTFFIDNQRMRIGASVGFAVLESPNATPDSLLQNADTALYHAKNSGRRCYRFFDETMQQAQVQSRDLEADLRQALEEDTFKLNYQPICDLASGKVVSYEALVRWPHPFLGMIPPTEFIPLAEKTGLMVPLGEWIIEAACKEAKRIPGALPVAVNISYTQLRDIRFLAIIRGAMKKNQILPSQLQIEITETVFMSDNDATIAILNELRTMGIKIALDDFGTGYSSLSYLQKFSFDKIKIDRSFINDTRRRSVNGAIIRAVIQLGKDLAIPIVAEGIETAQQLLALEQAKCCQGQGYLFGKPAPIEALQKK